MTRYFTALAVFLLLFTFTDKAQAQACGGSTRTIRLEYPAGASAAGLVEYELYYLMPKVDLGGDWQKQAKFLSKFLYGEPKADIPNFWDRYDDGTTFFEVPRQKAEDYIKGYKLEDFEFLYTNRWEKHEFDQLKGRFTGDTLRLITGETDGTTFIMKVTAKGYVTQYLLNDFLGGCHDNLMQRNGPDPAQKIVMKKSGK